MVLNPLKSDVQEQVDALLCNARESLDIVPERMKESVQDIIDTLTEYKESDEEPWPQWRASVPFEYVRNEFGTRLKLWRQNKVVSFQNDDAPKATMVERAVLTLNEGGFDAALMEGNVGIHVTSKNDEAIHYLDAHFLAHPYSAIKMNDGSVLFTVLDSRYYPVESFHRTEWGTNVLTVEDLKNHMLTFASEGEVYANHLTKVIGD
jgi:hypothetical protein